MPIKRMNLKKPERPMPQVNDERGDEFPLLRFYRNNEKISRVDRYSILMFWDDYDAEGAFCKVNEILFYPSPYGMDEINGYRDKDSKSMIGRTGLAKTLVQRLNQLEQYGNPWWRINVDEELTPENWVLRDPQRSTFQDKPIKKNPNYAGRINKLKLKPKEDKPPKRMRLRSNG